MGRKEKGKGKRRREGNGTRKQEGRKNYWPFVKRYNEEHDKIVRAKEKLTNTRRNNNEIRNNARQSDE